MNLEKPYYEPTGKLRSHNSISLSIYYCTTQEPEALTLTEHIASQWLEAGELSNLTWAAADEPIVEKIHNQWLGQRHQAIFPL